MGKHDITNEDKINKKAEKKLNKKKRRRIVLIIFLILFILLTVFIAIRFYKARGNWLAAMLGHNEETLKKLDKLQILIMGESTGMSDTIIVASYDPKAQQASLLTIPRDTFTGENKKTAKYYHKINALYNYGETPEKIWLGIYSCGYSVVRTDIRIKRL